MIEGFAQKQQRKTLAWKERAANDDVLQVILLVTRKLLSALPKNGNKMKVAFKRIDHCIPRQTTASLNMAKNSLLTYI